MIKTLIIDDERLIRMTLKQIIDWTSHGFQIIGEAQNGPEAIELIDQLKPDLIFLDINIPIINGIEVCHHIQEKNYHTKVVILTGYDSFRYAQECLRMGVLDYIVKPVEKSEFEKSVETIYKKITEHKTNEITSSNTNEYSIHYPFTTNADFSENIPENAILCIAEIDSLYNDHTTLSEQTQTLYRVVNYLQDSFYLNQTIYGLHIEQEQIIWYTTQSPLTAQTSIVTIQNQLWDYLNISLSVGICTLTYTNTNFETCKNIALQALSLKFYTGKRSCHLLESFTNNTQTTVLPFDQALFFNHISVDTPEEFFNFVKEKIEDIIKYNPPKNQLFLYCIQLLNQVTDYYHYSIGENTSTNKKAPDILLYLKRCEFYEDLITYLSDTIRDYMEEINSLNKYNSIVKNSIYYIQTHYQNPALSLSEIAKNLYVTNGYLSRTFKKETNYTITEYITKYRIKVAFQLLKSREFTKVSDIAESVGYTDSLYFSKLFKKETGISPSKYLQNHNTTHSTES